MFNKISFLLLIGYSLSIIPISTIAAQHTVLYLNESKHLEPAFAKQRPYMQVSQVKQIPHNAITQQYIPAKQVISSNNPVNNAVNNLNTQSSSVAKPNSSQATNQAKRVAGNAVKSVAATAALTGLRSLF